MPKTTYPDWVTNQRPKGHAVKKVGNQYYLYKHSSKRVPGKKYPQSVDTYVGVITKDGIVYRDVKKVTLSDVEVYEYGFSKALQCFVTDEWKKPLKNEWEDVLLAIIHTYSPNSYLFINKTVPEVHRNIALHAAKLEKTIFPHTFEDLNPLRSIYMIHFEEKDIISKIHPEQKELAESLSVKLEVN
jgi:hypothetical protein